MAALIRSNPTGLLRRVHKSIRLISTSPKKTHTAALEPIEPRIEPTPPINAEGKPDFSIEAVRKSKNWVSYGFDYYDKAWDRQVMRATMFASVTVCLVGTIFLLSYLPDPRLNEWAQREGYLVLREREAAGLVAISPDIIDPKSVQLPTDEELGDTEIII